MGRVFESVSDGKSSVVIMDIIEKIYYEKAILDDQEESLKTPYTAYLFAMVVPGADIEKCLEACRGTEYEDELNEYLMEKALM